MPSKNSMPVILRETYRLWSEEPGYRTRIEDARIIIRETLKKYNPYIAYSGGKDSLVMTHLTLLQNPNILVWHWDYGPYFVPREIENEIEYIAKTIGTREYEVDTSPEYRKGRVETAVKIDRRAIYGRIIPEMKNRGINASFIGLRSEESTKRKLRTKNTYEKTVPGMTMVFPIRGLTVRDIWAYIVSNNLPYCSHYDRYSELPGYENTRFCTYFDPEFAWMGCSNVDGVIMPEFRNI